MRRRQALPNRWGTWVEGRFAHKLNIPIHHRQFLIAINQRKRPTSSISPSLPPTAPHHILHKLLPHATLHKIIPQPRTPPPGTTTLVLLTPLLNRQILRHRVLQTVRMDLLGYFERGSPLPQVGKPCRTVLRLREEKVPSLREVTLEEQMRFAVLPGLAHQFQQPRLLLPVEIGLEGTLAPDVAQSDAPLPLLQEIQLHHAQLPVQRGSQLHMREIMPHPQLQHLDPSELRRKFGQPQPETLPPVLRQLQQGLLLPRPPPHRQQTVQRLPAALPLLPQPPLLRMDGVVLPQTLGHQLQKFAVLRGVLLDLQGEGVATRQQGEEFPTWGRGQLLVPPHGNGQHLLEDVGPELTSSVASGEGLALSVDLHAVVHDETLPSTLPAQPHTKTPLFLHPASILEQSPQQPLALLGQNMQNFDELTQFRRNRLHLKTSLPQQRPSGVDGSQFAHISSFFDEDAVVSLGEAGEFAGLLLFGLAVDLIDYFGTGEFERFGLGVGGAEGWEVVGGGGGVVGTVGEVEVQWVMGEGGVGLDADLEGEFLLDADLLEVVCWDGLAVDVVCQFG